MAPRTRRTTVKEHNGGVLASLCNNVPAIKGTCKQSKGKISKEKKRESIEDTSTPPPLKSVLVESDDGICSPLTVPRNIKQKSSTRLPRNSESSENSVDFSTPSPKGRSKQKRRMVIEESSDEENDDDETVQMEDEDANETVLEEETIESEDAEEESIDQESEGYFESESEDSEDDDDDAFEPEDDDEYIPDEDSASLSDEDLSDDYVQEELRKRTTTKAETNHKEKEEGIMNSTVSMTSKLKSLDITDGGDDDALVVFEESCDEGSDDDTVEAETSAQGEKLSVVGSPVINQSEEGILDEEQSQDTLYVYDDASVEAEAPKIQSPNTAVSPGQKTIEIINDIPMGDGEEGEILEASIVEDGEEFDEDDILVATVIDDTLQLKEEAAQAAGYNQINTDADGVNDRDEEDGKTDGNFCNSGYEEDDTSQQDSTDTKVRSKSKQSSIPDDSDEKLARRHGAAPPQHSEPATKDSSSRIKSRKGRKSFFRAEGSIKRGKWKLGSKIGVGSFGVVHVGLNNETGKLMAVKKFKVDDAVMKDIRREVDLMRALDHPNIVRYLGAEMDSTHLHIFQEWVPGGSVATLLGRFGPFSLQVIQSYLSQTLAGLAYLHESDIMHRDIKGSNILVNDEGIVKLADFGASKKLSNLRANLMMSMTVRGTPYFMSPEVFEEKYSAKADIWGIGCVAYQMISGSPPWKEQGFTNPISLFNYIKKHDGPPPIGDEDKERLEREEKSVYQCLLSFMEACFSKDPAERPDAPVLLEHDFFTQIHDDGDDESLYSRGLFSPKSSSETPKRWDAGTYDIPPSPSPSKQSPSMHNPPAPTPNTLGRSKSVVQWRTTFTSPPRSIKGGKVKPLTSPFTRSPYLSPQPDTSGWPEWAKAELQKRNLFGSSPRKEASQVDLITTMNSLALSEDSYPAASLPDAGAKNRRISTFGTTADQSKLEGLNFLEESTSTTYEI